MQYDPYLDYRSVETSEDGGALLSTREAASLLSLRSTEGVRRLIREGRLPGVRKPGNYNARWLVPKWAVEGLRQHRGTAAATVPAVPEPEVANLRIRVRALEDSIAILQEAREHEARAIRSQHETVTALLDVISALGNAASQGIVPSAPPTPDRPSGL